jgi:pimeloyl-ACP methyl ester carboxylesterase
MVYHAHACDLRGYSPAVQPESIKAYQDYNIFASDVLELANAAGLNNLYVIGHNHGATLG